MAERSDEELFSGWLAGDADAGARLLDRYLDMLAGFFGNKVTDPADVEELVGRSFERCTRRQRRNGASVRVHLYSLAREVLREYVQAKCGRPGASPFDYERQTIGELGPSQGGASQRKEQALLLDALRQIPLAYQLAIELGLFEEMTPAEIAEVLDLPLAAVTGRLQRGQALLEAELERLADSPQLLDSTRLWLARWSRAVEQLSDAEQPG